ncbi:hypothetical protein ABVT39_016224 [Epinephelus coioides]
MFPLIAAVELLARDFVLAADGQLPDSTAHIVHCRCCRVLQPSDLTPAVHCSSSTCDKYEEKNLAGAHTVYPEKLKEVDAEGGERAQSRSRCDKQEVK